VRCRSCHREYTTPRSVSTDRDATCRSVTQGRKEIPVRYFPNGPTSMPSRLLVGVALLALVAIAAASAFAAGGGKAIVRIGPTNLGRVLVDAKGKTLYIWAHDKGSKSTCNGDCAVYWPLLITQGRPQAIAGANSYLLGTSRRNDGRLQVT